MKKAILAFSGDPITFGHIDIIKRALNVFDEVTVGIGNNPEKKYVFTLAQRTEMAVRALWDLPRVKVVSFEGLLVDYAYENDIPVIIKGVRNSSDFDYEVALHHLGESQKLDIDTFLLPARQDLTHVSSSGVRALQQAQGLIHEYVPLHVKMCLEAKLSGQYILGVTGEIGVGKSYVSQKIEEIGKRRGIPVHHIELDHIGHAITTTLAEPSYEKVRERIAEYFGEAVRGSDGSIDRKALGEIVFSHQEKLDALNAILCTPLLVRLRRELYSRRGLILFNAALIAETNMSYLSNNHVLLVTADKRSQKRRLEERNLSFDQIKTRCASQYNFEEKKKRLSDQIECTSQGKLWIHDNSDSADEMMTETLFDDILSSIDVFGEMRFKSMWELLGANTSYIPEYTRLSEIYSGKQRYYHSISHILDGLEVIGAMRSKIERPVLIECAWWYHDVVYTPGSDDNEELSASEMEMRLDQAGVEAGSVRNIRELIRATRHASGRLSPDEKIIADIDLSILGRTSEEFDEYEYCIRKEFSNVSDQEYRSGRSHFLKNLCNRKSIFHTAMFRDRYEESARVNCDRLIEQLTGAHS